MPHNYDTIYMEFKKACKLTPEKVFPINDVLDDANRYYKLKTEKALIEFIANDGLEGRSFVNKKEWKNNFTKHKPLYAYAYLFRTNIISGYIAIVKNIHHNNWFIKSFHPPEDNAPTLALSMRALGLKSSEEK